jgi:hypothetical protein
LISSGGSEVLLAGDELLPVYERRAEESSMNRRGFLEEIVRIL